MACVGGATAVGLRGAVVPGRPPAPAGHNPYPATFPSAHGFPPRHGSALSAPPPSTPGSRRRALLGLVVMLVAAGAAATVLVLQLRPGEDEAVRSAVQRFVSALDRRDGPGLAAALCRQEASDVTEDDDFTTVDVGAPTPADHPAPAAGGRHLEGVRTGGRRVRTNTALDTPGRQE